MHTGQLPSDFFGNIHAHDFGRESQAGVQAFGGVLDNSMMIGAGPYGINDSMMQSTDK